ncbi:hypothetical protein M501DRAFT_1001953 [Patellaria atrata CBS 101060]|uniref:Acyl-CoA dehydrogenase/oxidase C-terminal domain-containing protein n=1 Tax=Patellaria atrata CBS 101060 TaxID=1346257 RepID=A0A9P4SDR9_9PEZI|nr:hypothetical protein M501DRAFT_1001953 [Patellaria atrata CBS 101060]
MASQSNHETIKPVPSSSTAGFFQSRPEVLNQFHDDKAFRRVVALHLPLELFETLEDSLDRFGSLVLSPAVLSSILDAEANPPYLQTWDTFGVRQDKLVTPAGWRELQALGIREGIVGLGYDENFGRFARLYQFLKYHLWSGSCANVTCPSAMTDGAARLLKNQLDNPGVGETERKIFEDAYNRLISRDPERAWTSGQWMTERIGGSDVRNTETLARYQPSFSADESSQDTEGHSLGPWAIDGFKWFSSATDSNMSVLLARTSSDSAKGAQISAFFAPMRRTSPSSAANKTAGQVAELNGIQIQRLKSKLGTRPLPTAELVLRNTRAWMIGRPGQGTKEISTILNISRVHNAVTAMGYLGRGLGISRAFAKVRKIGGKLLIETPVHVRTMADVHVQYRAHLHLTFFVVALLGLVERPSPPSSIAQSSVTSRLMPDPHGAVQILRTITPLTKACTALISISGLQACMESLGGIGYLENLDAELNIARLYRDANVLSIWEGTTNVLADDLIRVLKGRAGEKATGALDSWIDQLLYEWSGLVNQPQGDENLQVAEFRKWVTVLQNAWSDFKTFVTRTEEQVLKYRSRYLLEQLNWIICSILLVEDFRKDEDQIAAEVARRWILKSESNVHAETAQDVGKQSYWDKVIVFGRDDQGITAKL